MRPICSRIDSSDNRMRVNPRGQDWQWPVLLLVLLLAACDAGEPFLSLETGRWLTDDARVSCRHAPVVSLAPGDRWLLFWLEDLDPAPTRPWPAIGLGLLQLESGLLQQPAGQPQLKDPAVKRSFRPASLCWSDEGPAAYVLTESGFGWDGAGWFRLLVASDARLEPVDEPPSQCIDPSQQEWRWSMPETQTAAITRGLSVDQPTRTSVVLRLADGAELARHETRRRLDDDLTLSNYAWSRNGQWLAYRLSAHADGLPGARRQSLIVGQDGRGPFVLDTPVEHFFWLDDSEIIGCARRPRSEGGGFALRAWRLPTE